MSASDYPDEIDRERRIEDAIFMLENGETPERAAARIGMTRAGLEKMLRRWTEWRI